MDSVQGFDHTLALASCRRRMSTSCTNYNGFVPITLYEELDNHPDGYATLIVATGYNDSDRNFTEDIRNIATLARSHGYQRLVWLTLRSNVSYLSPDDTGFAEVFERSNAALRQIVEDGTYPELVIADWATFARDQHDCSVAMASTSARPAPTRRVTTSRARSHFSRFSPAHSPPMPASSRSIRARTPMCTVPSSVSSPSTQSESEDRTPASSCRGKARVHGPLHHGGSCEPPPTRAALISSVTTPGVGCNTPTPSPTPEAPRRTHSGGFMTHFCSSHRFPHADRDPIDDSTARLLFESTLAIPRRPETVVVLLDHDRRGRSILNVDRTDHPDAVLDVAELSIALADGSPAVSGALIASVRPAGGDKLDDVE